MSSERKQIHVRDIHERVLRKIGEQIQNYSVGIMSLYRDGDRAKAELMGSGTLVSVGAKHGILTAAHVISETKCNAFRRAEKIGICFHRHAHNWHQEKQHFNYDIIALNTDPPGPDLGVVWLPDIYLGELKANKSFWNLTRYADPMLHGANSLGNGVWSVVGCPDESTAQLPSTQQFRDRIGLSILIGYSGIEVDESRDGYDYYRLSVSYHEEQSEPPHSFGGVSGGGLWQTILRKGESGTPTCDHPVLSGVAFWQSAVENGKRYLLCHGRDSIYRELMKRL